MKFYKRKTVLAFWLRLCLTLGMTPGVSARGAGLGAESSAKEPPDAVSAAAIPAAKEGLRLTSPPAPWGNLEFQPLPLENSQYLFLDGAERLKLPHWVFRPYTAGQLRDLLDSCGLTGPQRASLQDTNHWEVLPDGFAISPSGELVRGLSQGARQRLYAALGRNPQNYVQAYPFRFPPGGFDERFLDSGLSDEKINLLRGMTYTNAGALCLSLEWPLAEQFNTNEFKLITRALYSTPSVNVRLRVGAESDLEALVKYWGRHGREKAVRPMLESLARVRGGGKISVSYFFPPFAKLRLYTFPDTEGDPEAGHEDCFFTSLNFFNDQPDSRYLDAANARKALQTDYDVVAGGPEFGDLIMLTDAAGNAAHICVYVAADVVFTKNGANFLQPWVMMKLPEVLAFYPTEQPWRMVAFRKKG